MAIHYLIPLIATFIYVSLLLVVIINRPWQKQHKLFILYLAAATLWGFSNFLLLSNSLMEYKLFLFRIVTFTSIWWAVQLYYTCLIMQVASEVVKGAQSFHKYPKIYVDVYYYYYLLLVIDYILIEVTRRSRLFV